MQGQNELWLALVLTHPAMFGLSGPELAGVLGAILSGEVVRKTGNIKAAYTASQKVSTDTCTHTHAHTRTHAHTLKQRFTRHGGLPEKGFGEMGARS
jgi:hypothetical protein